MQRIFFYLVCVFIAYGSLYPFEFSSKISRESIEAFLVSWRPTSSIGDVLGNIVLFIPFGFLGYRLQPLWGLSLIGLLLTFGLQVAQLYLPSRSPAFYDVYWNSTGTAIGFASAYLLNPCALFKNRWGFAEKHSAIALLMLWGAFQLLPFVPTLDWQSYKNAVKPLILSPRFVWADFLFLTVSWLVVVHFAEKILGKLWRGIYPLTGIMLVLALKIVVVTNQLALSDLIAGATAAALYPVVRQTNNGRTVPWAWLLLFGYAINVLFPFQLQSEGKSFAWLPFSGFLDGSMIVNSSALCKKLFVFAGIFLLLKDAKLFNLLTVLAVTAVVTLLELCQLWIVGRTAEITDPLLVILMAWLIAQIRMAAPSRPVAQASTVVQAAARILQAGLLPQATEKSLKTSDEVVINSAQKRNVIFIGLAACLGIAFCFYEIVRLPNVPYNVRELFKYGGTGIDLFIFGLALLAIGAGSAWMGRSIASSQNAIFKAPRAAVIVSIVIYILFFASVTQESMMDIAGSSVVVHRVGERGVLGEIGKDIVAAIGADNLRSVTDVFEPVVRFGALLGPLIIILGLIFAALFRNQRNSGSRSSGSFLSFCRQLFIYVIYMLPWLYFCKVIAFDWSSTDNLNELIARDGEYGMGGGGFLYGLVGLISLLAGCLAWSVANKSRAKVMVLLTLSLVSVVPGWLLVNSGLTDNVGKYGLNFSGIDFLLGPDRSHLLSITELFLRWTLVQFLATVGLAFGAMLYLKWCRQLVDSETQGGGKAKVTGGVLSGLLVPLELNQVEFLNELAVQIGENFSSTIGLIITFLKKEMGSSMEAQKLVYDEIKKYAEERKEKKILVRPVSLKLSSGQMKIITEIQVSTEAGYLDVIGGLVAVFRLVTIFMGTSQLDSINR